jgi:hypothetical protein
MAQLVLHTRNRDLVEDVSITTPVMIKRNYAYVGKVWALDQLQCRGNASRKWKCIIVKPHDESGLRGSKAFVEGAYGSFAPRFQNDPQICLFGEPLARPVRGTAVHDNDFVVNPAALSDVVDTATKTITAVVSGNNDGKKGRCRG